MATTSNELLTLSNIARFEGWVPVRIYESASGTMVDWCYLGKRAFREVTFAQTIEESLHIPRISSYVTRLRSTCFAG